MLNYIDGTVKMGKDSIVGNYSTIEGNCVIGKHVIIHNNVTIYSGTVIGDGTEIFDGVIIGRPPKTGRNTVHQVSGTYSPVQIGKDCIIGSNTVIYAQCILGNQVLIGDGAKLREGARIGDNVLVAMNCTLNHDVTLGNRSRVMDLSHLTANTIVEDGVFVGVGVVTVNDNAMRSAGTGVKEVGNTVQICLGSSSRIGSGALILPNMKVGKDALVGACALVTHDVPEGVRVMGIPAKER